MPKVGFGVHIAGFGKDNTKSKGALFYTGAAPPDSNFEALELLAVPPPQFGVSVDELEGRPNAGSARFALDYKAGWSTGEPNFFLVDYLVSPSRERQRTLTAEVGRADTTIDVDATFLEGDVIWVNAEAILMGTHAGGGQYTGCTRGYYGTEAHHHSSGHYYHYRPHLVRNAHVTLYDWEEGSLSSMVARWAGYITTTNFAQRGTQVAVNCRGLLASQWNAKLGEQRAELGPTEYQLDYSLDNTNARNPVVDGTISQSDTDVRLTGSWESDGRGRAYQIGEGLAFEKDQQVDEQLAQLDSKYDADFDVDDESRIYSRGGGPRQPIKSDVREVAAFGRLVSEAALDATYGIGVDVVPTQNATYPHHPVTVAMALLQYSDNGSGTEVPAFYTFLKRVWTLDLIHLFSSAISDADSVIAETSWLEIDHLILGWDGEPVEAWDIINGALLNPAGFYWGMQTNAKPNLNRHRMATIDDYADALGRKLDPIGVPEWDPNLVNQQLEVTGEAGKLPWNSRGEPVTWDVQGVQLPKVQEGGGRTHSYDFRAYSKDSALALGGRLAGKVILEYFKPPVVQIEVEDWRGTSVDLDIGAWNVINQLAADPPWAPDPDSSTLRTNDLTDEKYIGRVSGWQYNRKRRTYTVSLKLFNYLFGQVVRWRAPSAIVTASPSANRYYVDATSNFGADGPDNQEFEVGDQVRLFDKNLDQKGAQRTITAIGNDGTSDYFDIDGADWTGVTFDEDMITIDDYDGYTNDDAHLADVTRVYLWLADSNSQLGAANDDAMIYGV